MPGKGNGIAAARLLAVRAKREQNRGGEMTKPDGFARTASDALATCSDRYLESLMVRNYSAETVDGSFTHGHTSIRSLSRVRSLAPGLSCFSSDSSGLRRAELVRLKIADFNRNRRTLHIRQGKGRKDRV